MTAEELAQLLTREVRIIGDPKILRCHASVFEALWLALPEADPMPPYEPPDFFGPGMISRLLSIPVITDEDYAPGEWRLVRASDDSVVHEGVIT